MGARGNGGASRQVAEARERLREAEAALSAAEAAEAEALAALAIRRNALIGAALVSAAGRDADAARLLEGFVRAEARKPENSECFEGWPVPSPPVADALAGGISGVGPEGPGHASLPPPVPRQGGAKAGGLTPKQADEARRRAGVVKAAIEQIDSIKDRAGRKAAKASHAEAFGCSPGHMGVLIAAYRKHGEKGLLLGHVSRLDRRAELHVAQAIRSASPKRGRNEHEKAVARKAVHAEVVRLCAADGTKAPSLGTVGKRIDEWHERRTRGGRPKSDEPEGQGGIPLV